MAGTGLGLFLPSETAYKDPGRFRDVLEAEGSKEAKYLASMDQFFAQLEESQRQFDITTEQRQEFFEEEMAWNREEQEAMLEYEYWAKEQDVGVAERGQDVQRYDYQSQANVGMAGVGAQMAKVAAERERTASQYDIASRELEQTAGVNAFYQNLYRGKERREQETHDVARAGIASLSVGTYGGYGDYDFGDIYSSRDSSGSLSFSNTPTQEEYNPKDWENTLW